MSETSVFEEWLQDLEQAGLLPREWEGRPFSKLPEAVQRAVRTLVEGSSFEKYKPYVDSVKIAEALWWFIENITDDDPAREDWFFYLRERYRKEVKV